MTYFDKLKDPRWQKKRLEILNRDAFQCVECDDTVRTLHVHHLYYIKGRAPWNYPTWALVTLCAKCHKITQDLTETEFSPFEFLIQSLSDNGSPYALEHISAVVDDLRCTLQSSPGPIVASAIKRLIDKHRAKVLGRGKAAE